MSYVNISPEELLRVTTKCLSNIENYNGEDNKTYDYSKTLFNLIFVREKTFTVKPTWTYDHCGIITRLNELKSIAENVVQDKLVEDRDVKLSLTTHSELYKLLNKSKDFQPYIFGMGY